MSHFLVSVRTIPFDPKSRLAVNRTIMRWYMHEGSIFAEPWFAPKDWLSSERPFTFKVNQKKITPARLVERLEQKFPPSIAQRVTWEERLY